MKAVVPEHAAAMPSSSHEGPVELPWLDRPFETGLWKKVQTLAECRQGSKTFLAHNARPQDGPALPAIFAVRRMPKASQACMLEELRMLRQLQHACGECPNLLKTFGIWQDHAFFYVASECCQGGDVFTWARAKGRCPDGVGKILARQMLAPMALLHAKGFVHAGTRLENFHVAAGGIIKLAELTQVCRTAAMPPGDATQQVRMHLEESAIAAGHKAYTPPELLQVPRQAVVDFVRVNSFQVGMALFALLVGKYPANPAQVPELLAAEDHLSDECRDLLKQLLALLPEERPTAKGALSHPWLSLQA